MYKLLTVKIEEEISGHFLVVVNNISIARYTNWDDANKLVEHFLDINKNKNPLRV